MLLVRTDKQFIPENMTLDFLRQALSLAGLHSSPLKYEENDFVVIVKYRGEQKGSSVTPWEDSYESKGYVKTHYLTKIEHARGFDCFANIFVENGKLQGYYHKSGDTQFAPDPLKWINLLLEYGFIDIQQ
ncbi:hypothetical protein D3C72_700790 [compost metagenome]